MPAGATAIRVRPLDELDLGSITRIDERITGIYRPEVWEQRVGYYMRRDPGASQVAEVDGKVVGFMLGDLRAGEFGLEAPSGWIERFGIDPDHRGKDLGRKMFDSIRAHFAAEGATCVRTLADREQAGVSAFLAALGFEPAPLVALELPIQPTPAQERK